MRHSTARSLLVLLPFAALLLGAEAPSSLYQKNCAGCHDGGAGRAPGREALQEMQAERVLQAMETGPMITMAVRLSAAERRSLAEFLTGKSLSEPLITTPSPQAMCAARSSAFPDPSQGPFWSGWGQNPFNTRFQGAAAAGIDAAAVPRLKLKWAFGFPGDLQANGGPALANGHVFVGSPGGKVYSLDAASGCIQWYFQADGSVRSAISIGRLGSASSPRHAAFFGDSRAFAYAVDAATGKLIWKTKVDDFPLAHLTGSPLLFKNRLYVPVSSGEEAAGAVPDYECCRFRGSVVALDADNGKQVWKTYTISEEPRPVGKNKLGTRLWGPSGAPIWSSPAADPQRNCLYVTTGDNYSEPATRTSDAFLALDLDTGKLLWSRQMTEKDTWNTACRMPDHTNCPSEVSPDFDFSSSPILITLPNGKRMLLAGQKSGIVHALDPDNQGEVIWQVRVSKGGTMGGVQWGSAVDSSNVYVAVSDIGRIMRAYTTTTDADPKVGGGIFALRITNGERVWYTPPVGCGTRTRCSPAQSAAVTAIPGVVFSGSVDGHLRAYSAKDGAIVWDFDTERTYQAVNGVPAHGGSIDGPGPVIGGGMLFVNSGYPTAGGMSGNVLLAFSVDGK